ncbi:MAG: ABC transporter substrate-binding protein, partial [Sinobacterium sp.]|nr:ABC transporter substrate-binding protein [Sinobacterium sp.]
MSVFYSRLCTCTKFLLTAVALLNTHSLLAETHAIQVLHKSHAIAMHGDIKYPENFSHFDYTNPNAPKTGRIKLASQGGFDSLNPFIAKGSSADYIDLIYDTLTTSSFDEPFTHYGLIAEEIIWPEDRSYVEYRLNPKATFSDGVAVTSKDVKFTFNLLMDKASPAYKTQYAGIASIDILGSHRIRFNFKNNDNAELVLIVGQLPVLPSHLIKPEEFERSSLAIPTGSGPYIISSVDTGKRTTFVLNENYWARDLNVNKGRYNFQRIDIDYYRDSTVMLEALKSGEYDFRYENVSKLWATAYDSPAV